MNKKFYPLYGVQVLECIGSAWFVEINAFDWFVRIAIIAVSIICVECRAENITKWQKKVNFLSDICQVFQSAFSFRRQDRQVDG